MAKVDWNSDNVKEFMKRSVITLLIVVSVLFIIDIARLEHERSVALRELIEPQPRPVTYRQETKELTLFADSNRYVTDLVDVDCNHVYPLEVILTYVTWADGREDLYSFKVSKTLTNLGVETSHTYNTTTFSFEDYSTTFDIGTEYLDSIDNAVQKAMKEHSDRIFEKRMAFLDKYVWPFF